MGYVRYVRRRGKRYEHGIETCATYQQMGEMGVHAYLKRQDVMRFEDQLAKLAINGLPKFVQGPLGSFIKPWLTSANQRINPLLESTVTGTGKAGVWELQSDVAKCIAPPKPPGQPSPNPSASSDNDNAALVGTWPCDVHATIVNKELGAFSVSVQAVLSFNKNGTASGMSFEGASLSGSRSVYNGPGTGAAHIGSPSGYTYISTGTGSGMLHVDGKDLHLTWSGPNAFSFPAMSPISHRTYTYNCTRK